MQPLRYFERVRIRHKQSGQYLIATEEKYKERWSAPDQNAVLLKAESESADFDWIIRPPCGMDFLKNVGDEIVISDNSAPSGNNIVRIYNKNRDQFLHSHGDRSAPWSPQDPSRKEVTLFKTNGGLGDDNDNWQLYLVPQAQENQYAEIYLRHENTSGMLTSDGKRNPNLKSTTAGFALWTEPDQSQESVWVIEPKPDIENPFVPDVVVQYQSEGRTVALREIPQSIDRLKRLAEAYRPFIAKGSRSPYFAEFTNQISGAISTMERYLNDFQGSDDVNGFHLLLMNFRESVRKTFEVDGLPDFDGRTFDFLQRLFQSHQEESLHALMHVMKAPSPGMTPDLVTGVTKLTLFQQFGSESPKVDWKAPLDAFQTSKEKIDLKIATADSQLQTIITSSKDLVANVRSDQKKLAQEAEADLHRIRETFRGKELAEAPGAYWTQKKRRHQISVGILAFLFAASVTLLVVGFVWVFFTYKIGDQFKELPYQDFFLKVDLPIAAIASLIVWLIKTISRNLISQIHLAADANERETMLLTFRALLLDKEKPLGTDEKAVIVSIVFRPAGSGLGEENSGPTFLWEALLQRDKNGK